MARNALVLGGGGVLGISWETGILKGLAEAGVDVTNADLLVGTSAGSVVASEIAQGMTLEHLIERHNEERPDGIESNMEFDMANLFTIFQKWGGYTEITQKDRAEIGAMAIASRTVTEERWVNSFADLLDGNYWPERDLRLTAVDAESGEFAVWTRDSGVELQRAVASSCAVPGLFPVVTINGRKYQDGGVRSGTSADLATRYDAVLIIAPIGARADSIDPLLGGMARNEAEQLRAEGSHVDLVFCDAASLEAMGLNRMDGARRGITAEAGIAQGRALARQIEAAWSKAAA